MPKSRIAARAVCASILAAVSLGAGAAAQDADGDAIPDSIESQAWYTQAGGSPQQKDVWVECDYMKKSVKKRAKLRNRAQGVFGRAPVVGGVRLHLVFDDKIPFDPQWGDISTPEGATEFLDEVEASYLQRFDGRPFTGGNAGTMRPYMHYCMFVDSIGADGTSGISFGIPSQVFVVSVGQYRDLLPKAALRAYETGTFLHELGHNLGLTHGGDNPGRHATYKPNYLSVMNYHFQLAFVRLRGGVPEYFNYWDYARAKANTLNEKKLREGDGISLPAEAVFADTPQADELLGVSICPDEGFIAFRWNAPVDFDCDGAIRSGTVKVDTNLDGKHGKLGGGRLDWEELVYDFAGATQRVFLSPSEEMDRRDLERLIEALESPESLRVMP